MTARDDRAVTAAIAAIPEEAWTTVHDGVVLVGELVQDVQ